jgi:cytidine deaminase
MPGIPRKPTLKLRARNKEAQRELLDAAWAAREHAVALYSGFKVGAALRDADGRVFTGCNIENSTYGLTVCAERVAVWKALSEGSRSFTGIAVVTESQKLTPPCGPCRQILWEFCGDMEIILANKNGLQRRMQLRQLFPEPFEDSFFRSK